MKARLFISWLFLVICGIRPVVSYAALNAVWANEGGDKVTQDELRATVNPAAVVNSAWDGTTVKLFGARNEVVSFNLVLEAQGGASAVRVSFDRLTNSQGGTIASTPASGDQIFNYVGRNIELFFVRYLQIKGLSVAGYSAYDERHIPRRMRRPWVNDGIGSGTWQNRPDHDKFYPDIAVPLELTPEFSIAAGKNQSIWGDIYIPKTAAAGVYAGTITVREAGTVTRQVPIQLSVRGFTLPDASTAKTTLAYSSSQIRRRFFGSYYLPSNSPAGIAARAVRDRYFQMAHRHRMSMMGDNVDDCDSLADRPCPEWIPRLTGGLFTAASGYDGPGVGVGNDIYSIGTYGNWLWKSGGQAAMNQHTDAWATWFAQNSPNTLAFLFLADEFFAGPEVEQWAQWIHQNPGPGQQLKSFLSSQLPTAAVRFPSVDLISSFLYVGDPAVWEPLAQQYNSNPAKQFTLYNPYRPSVGSFATEDDGVALRMVPWAQYKKRIPRWWFWESAYYHNLNFDGTANRLFSNARTSGVRSPTPDPILGETGHHYSNGNGVLFYPGTDAIYPEESYGVQGPFASLRLKHWRRGIQDVDYLQAAAAINPEAVQTIVNTMIPKVVWEYGVTDPNDPSYVRTAISWSDDPEVWESTRKQLADIIAPAQLPIGVHDGSDCTHTVGWACDADNYNAPLTIHFYADGPPGVGTFVGAAAANLPREAGVGAVCGGNTNHGFDFPTPSVLRDGGNHTIYAYAINLGGEGGNPLLGGSPRSVGGCTPPPRATGDYNGDGKTDFAVWRPSEGNWYLNGIATTQWGLSTDIPAPGDYNGDRIFDVAVWRPSDGAWYVKDIASVQWGVQGDIPVPGDYNADGKTDVAVWRPSNGLWYVKDIVHVEWGTQGDVPVPGDYNADGKTDVAVWRPSNGLWYVKDIVHVEWGTQGDVPVPGDYNADGKTDVAVWRPSNGFWYVKDIVHVEWGTPGDVPVPGDYNADGKTDVAVWRPSNGFWYIKDIAHVPWGTRGDIPVVNNVLGGLHAAKTINVATHRAPAPAITAAASELDHVQVFPNPWRSDRHNVPLVTFRYLTAGSSVKIFTVSGRFVASVPATADPTVAQWSLTNDSGERVASGLYLYLVSDSQGNKKRGKLAVIR